MNKWEYLVVFYEFNALPSEDTKFLNRIAADGWELVQPIKDKLLFRRLKEE